MKKAMELLNDTDMLIRDVSIAVGIEDQLYFNKVFKKFYHMSPSDVRKK
jgi:AraC-like DNA-binding protein